MRCPVPAVSTTSTRGVLTIEGSENWIQNLYRAPSAFFEAQLPNREFIESLRTPVRTILRRANALVALVTLVAGQVVCSHRAASSEQAVRCPVRTGPPSRS
jgi:hypothetical protein